MTILGSFCPTKKIDLVFYYSLRILCQVNTKSTDHAKIPHPITMLSITKSQDILEAVHQNFAFSNLLDLIRLQNSEFGK